MKETRILERDDGTIAIRRIGTSGKWATSTPEMIGPLMQHITAIGAAMDAVTPDEDLALERARKQADEQAKAAEAARAEAAEKEVELKKKESQIARLILGKDITQEELSAIIADYPEWSGAGVSYSSGDNVRYQGKLWQCVQGHVSQPDWAPGVAASLWMGDTPDSVIAEFKQPTGAHDAYKKGDRVIWSGVVYESLIDGNTYSPGDYPQGWTVIPGD